jgi:hypothetical protein
MEEQTDLTVVVESQKDFKRIALAAQISGIDVPKKPEIYENEIATVQLKGTDKQLEAFKGNMDNLEKLEQQVQNPPKPTRAPPSLPAKGESRGM